MRRLVAFVHHLEELPALEELRGLRRDFDHLRERAHLLLLAGVALDGAGEFVDELEELLLHEHLLAERALVLAADLAPAVGAHLVLGDVAHNFPMVEHLDVEPVLVADRAGLRDLGLRT